MTPGEIKRLYFILRIFFLYGLDQLFPKIKFTLPLYIGRLIFFWIKQKHQEKKLSERLCLALQELGPVWIKFGQMISTCQDLFSPDITDQLSLLQDKVISFDGKRARNYIEKSLGGSIEQWFDDFEEKALASASISQVHTAKLKENGKKIVIKVIRPDILPIIKADIKLMYRIANWVALLPDGRRLRPKEVVREYEKTLFDELNLLRESANAMQLRSNFKNSSMLYVPEVYINYCSKNVMVMERIYGIPISNISALKAQGTNMKILAERGVKVLFTQVFRDSFFHADMHPGNIFVSYEHPEDPLYIGIDCGIVGSLNKEDKRYLAENFIAFFNRDYRKVAELHIDSGWVPQNTNIKDFEFAIKTVCAPIFDKPLSEISFGHVLLNLFNAARRFNMEVQPQLVLLQKTLLYVEGLGRKIYPTLDLWKTAKPFLENWIDTEMGILAITQALKEKSPYWVEKIPEIPDLIYSALRQHKFLESNIKELTQQLKEQRNQQCKSQCLLGSSVTCIFCGNLFFICNTKEIAIVITVAGVLAWIIGWYKAEKH